CLRQRAGKRPVDDLLGLRRAQCRVDGGVQLRAPQPCRRLRREKRGAPRRSREAATGSRGPAVACRWGAAVAHQPPTLAAAAPAGILPTGLSRTRGPRLVAEAPSSYRAEPSPDQ